MAEQFIRLDDDADDQFFNLRSKLQQMLYDPNWKSASQGDRRKKLSDALGLRKGKLSERMLDFFLGTEGNEMQFSVEDTMDWLRLLCSSGHYKDKAHFLFFMYDVKNEGVLRRQDMLQLAADVIKSNKFEFKEVSRERIEETMFEQFGDKNLDEITPQIFEQFCLRNRCRDILNSIAIGKLVNNTWMKESQEQAASHDIQTAMRAFAGKNASTDRRNMPWGRRLYYKWIMKWPKYVATTIWIAATIVTFAFEWHKFNTELNYEISYYAIPTAKACGAGLRLNCHLVMLPVMKRLITRVRDFLYNRRSGEKRTDFKQEHGPTWLWEKYLSFHIRMVLMIVALAFGHTVSHIINIIFMAYKTSDSVLMNEHYNWCCDKGSYFDRFPQLSSEPTFFHILFLAVPGWSGIMLWSCLATFGYTARQKKRAENHERFYYLHWVCIITWLIMLNVHGSTQVITAPKVFYWTIAFGGLLVLEVLLRVWSRTEVEVYSAVVDPTTKWVALRLAKPKNFHYRTGAYAKICVPEISSTQYHPFTISSTPESEYVGFHIKADGDWTRMMSDLMDARQDNFPKVILEGPYASAAEHVFEYDTVLLFSAGVGVTPYASILQTVHAIEKGRKGKGTAAVSVRRGVDMDLPNIHFHWTCRDQFSFSWFGKVFEDLMHEHPSGGGAEQAKIQKMSSLSHHIYEAEVLDLNLYMTGALPEADVTNTLIRMTLDTIYHKTKTDIVTEVSGSGQTHFGRPNVESILEKMVNKYPGKEIGVFACGPPPFVGGIHRLCMDKTGKRDTIFRYYEEQFG
eukprot:TRINITY_DN12227_c0_g1_i1.p1 TRINITY_DN12227_c0_g1~~TRINITY_DN12227_c0_g1_i1.p1  ORF type:complete len:795 (+),score=351.14 TRINITY_DN12227_c0_g1_i1:96-2480(+)